MDAESKKSLHDRLAELLSEMNAWFDRLAPPAAEAEPGAVASPPAAVSSTDMPTELEDRVLSLEERFVTLNLRVEMAERRSSDFVEDTRHRLRLLRDRVTDVEDRLRASEDVTTPPRRESLSHPRR
ncbi:MAG: hypothetical protein ACOCVZ_08295 [Gemmatimonadota bacterium]